MAISKYSIVKTCYKISRKQHEDIVLVAKSSPKEPKFLMNSLELFQKTCNLPYRYKSISAASRTVPMVSIENSIILFTLQSLPV